MPKKKEGKGEGKRGTKYERPEDTPGFAWRVSLSIIAFIALIVFVVLWLFFFADKFTIYQNLAVLLVAFLIFIAIMGTSWAHWGLKYGRKYEKCCED